MVGQKIFQTGGDLLKAIAGVEFGFKNIALGVNAQIPVAQNFASGQTKSNVGGMAHITFSF